MRVVVNILIGAILEAGLEQDGEPLATPAVGYIGRGPNGSLGG